MKTTTLSNTLSVEHTSGLLTADSDVTFIRMSEKPKAPVETFTIQYQDLLTILEQQMLLEAKQELEIMDLQQLVEVMAIAKSNH